MDIYKQKLQHCFSRQEVQNNNNSDLDVILFFFLLIWCTHLKIDKCTVDNADTISYCYIILYKYDNKIHTKISFKTGEQDDVSGLMWEDIWEWKHIIVILLE